MIIALRWSRVSWQKCNLHKTCEWDYFEYLRTGEEEDILDCQAPPQCGGEFERNVCVRQAPDSPHLVLQDKRTPGVPAYQ